MILNHLRPSNTVSYIRRVGADPDLVLKLTTQKIERRSLKVLLNCAFIILFFLTSLFCSLYGISSFSSSLPFRQLLLEVVDSVISLCGIIIGAYGVYLSRSVEFQPVERYSRLSMGFGLFYIALFICKVVLEGASDNSGDVLSLFRECSIVAALCCYGLILVVLGFFVARFVTQIRKFGTDLVQLKAHTIPLLNKGSGKKTTSQLTL